MSDAGRLASGGASDSPDDAAVRGSATELAGFDESDAMGRRLLRLAFDVHDGPMQDLIGIAWRLQLTRERVIEEVRRGELASLAAVFDDLAADLGDVEAGLRSLMFALERNAGPVGSLPLDVDAQVEAFKRHASASVEVSVSGDVEPRTDSQRIALERVLRESLSNVAKHARAEHVEITLRGTDESIVLEVRDDGCGFVPGASADGRRRFGIHAMRERLRLLGGDFTIDSHPGGPTIVTAQLLKWQPSCGVLQEAGCS